MNTYLRLPALLLFAAVMGSCCLLGLGCKDEAKAPAYIYIPRVDFHAGVDKGTSSSKILYVYVYANAQLVGGFPTPCTVPILSTGNTEIKILNGVSENGIISTPATYPFYSDYSITKSLQAGKTDTITPSLAYATQAVFSKIEDFENGNDFGYEIDGDVLTTLQTTQAAGEVFEGKRSGKIQLTDDHIFCAAATTTNYTLPTDGQPVWLELNYRCSNSFSVGIIGYGGSKADAQYQYKVTLNPRDTWNKIYISLTAEVNSLHSLSGNNTFRVVFSSQKDNGTNGTPTNIWVDNVKLIHF